MKNPPRGFGVHPRGGFWLQSVFADEDTSEKYVPCYGSGAKAKDKAIALLADQAIECVLLLRGQANPDDITRTDILADFQREWRPGTKRIQ